MSSPTEETVFKALREMNERSFARSMERGGVPGGTFHLGESEIDEDGMYVEPENLRKDPLRFVRRYGPDDMSREEYYGKLFVPHSCSVSKNGNKCSPQVILRRRNNNMVRIG